MRQRSAARSRESIWRRPGSVRNEVFLYAWISDGRRRFIKQHERERSDFRLVRNEDTRNPLSDKEIVEILSDRGIPIARRTVAKYRAELNILPSNLRKQY